MRQFSGFKIGKYNHLIFIKSISIFREQHLEDTLRKRNVEFKLLEDRLQQFEGQVRHYISSIWDIERTFLDTKIRTITSITSANFRENNTRLSHRK